MTQPPTSPSSDDSANGDPNSTLPPYGTDPASEPLQSPVGSAEYAQTPYGPVPTDLYGSPAANAAAAQTAAVNTVVRRWQIITAVACAAAALVILGFFIVGQKSGTAAPTRTVTSVATTTETETSTGAARTKVSTQTATETAERTSTETETRTRTATVTDTTTVTKNKTTTINCTTAEGAEPVCTTVVS